MAGISRAVSSTYSRPSSRPRCTSMSVGMQTSTPTRVVCAFSLSVAASSSTDGRTCESYFGRIPASFSSSRGQQPALKRS